MHTSSLLPPISLLLMFKLRWNINLHNHKKSHFGEYSDKSGRAWEVEVLYQALEKHQTLCWCSSHQLQKFSHSYLRTISVLPLRVLTEIFCGWTLHFTVPIGNVISHCHGLNFYFHLLHFSCVHIKNSLATISSLLFLSFLKEYM